MADGSNGVFLNIPYDGRFQKLYYAYLVGLKAFGLSPRAALELPASRRRLDRIQEHIRSCRYSIHDLSRVQLDPIPPRTPRFNMPFELGLTLGQLERGRTRHQWFVFEERPWRLLKSLSDLGGTDPYIHGGRPEGVFRELCNIFSREGSRPDVPELMEMHRVLSRAAKRIRERLAADDVYHAEVFRRLVLLAGELVKAKRT